MHPVSKELHQILSEHKATLTKEVIKKIREKELNQEFPFNLLNDLRGYINYSPFYFEAFAEAFANPAIDKLEKDTLEQVLGNLTRMRRYLLQVLLGAYLTKRFTQEEKISVLNRLAKILAKKKAQFFQDSLSKTTTIIDMLGLTNQDFTIEDKELTTRLFIKVRECVDFLFLGEHSISYQPLPPEEVEKYKIVVRKFNNLAYRNYLSPYRKLIVVDAYVEKDSVFNLDVFRGRVSPIPSYKEKRMTGFVLDGEKGSRSEALNLLQKVNSAVAEIQSYYQTLSIEELELEKMELYSFEISNLFDLLGREYNLSEESKQTILRNKKARKIKRDLEFDTYSDTYFYLLKQTLNWVLSLP